VAQARKRRLAAGAARGTVNHELAYLRHGFKLMLKARDISTIPAVIELLQGENVLKGFIAPGEFDILAENIPDVEVRDLVAFLYTQGWRSGERKNLEWSEVDLKNNMIRLPAEKSKSKKTAKPADHRRAFGNHRPAVSSPAPGLSLRVPSERQKDCLIPESLQSSGSSSESTGTCAARYETVGRP